jgi:hypothetical protein
MAEGTCSDSVLVWNSGTCAINIVPYTSGETSGGGDVTGGTNGLHKVGKNIELGGDLTGDTYINTNSGCLIITGNTCYGLRLLNCAVSIGDFYNGNGNSFMVIDKIYSTPYACTFMASNSCVCYGLIQVQPDSIILQTNNNQYNHLQTAIGLSGSYLTLSAADNTALSTRIVCLSNTESLKYGGDYSSSFATHSLVDKQYVDNKVLTGSTCASLSVFTITGNSTATGFTVNHGKGKQFVAVEIVRGSSPYDTVYTSVQRPNTNCVCVTFDTAPGSGCQFKILITS